jgi:hypothetical protein
MLRLIVFIAVLLTVSPSTFAQDDPDYNSDTDWLKKENWPKIVAADYPKVAETDDPQTKALKERLAASQIELREEYRHWLMGQGTVKVVADAAKQTMEARLDFDGSAADRLGALKQMLELAQLLEVQTRAAFDRRGAMLRPERAKMFYESRDRNAIQRSQYFRADYELALMREEGKAKSTSSP